jgi:hypothetical protein
MEPASGWPENSAERMTIARDHLIAAMEPTDDRSENRQVARQPVGPRRPAMEPTRDRSENRSC